MSGLLRFVQSLGLLIARVVVGLLLIRHGYDRWMGPSQGIAKQVTYLSQFGTPYPKVAAWGGILIEMVGGLFLVVGALTPLVAAILLAEQVLIICYTNWYHARDLYPSGDPSAAFGLERNVFLGLLCLLFVVCGAGAVAVDRLFRRKKGDLEDDDVAPTRTPVRV